MSNYRHSDGLEVDRTAEGLQTYIPDHHHNPHHSQNQNSPSYSHLDPQSPEAVHISDSKPKRISDLPIVVDESDTYKEVHLNNHFNSEKTLTPIPNYYASGPVLVRSESHSLDKDPEVAPQKKKKRKRRLWFLVAVAVLVVVVAGAIGGVLGSRDGE